MPVAAKSSLGTVKGDLHHVLIILSRRRFGSLPFR